jgi:hypothetical protein
MCELDENYYYDAQPDKTEFNRRTLLAAGTAIAGSLLIGSSAVEAGSPLYAPDNYFKKSFDIVRRSQEVIALPAPTEIIPGVLGYRREEWGGDLLPKGMIYPEDVRFLQVHHSASPNDYSEEMVPGILRGVYYFHTGPEKNWPDICYNLFLDRYTGYLYEGRTGSLGAQPVQCDASGGNPGFMQQVCILGDFTNEVPYEISPITGREESVFLDSLIKTLAWLCDRSNISTEPDATAQFISRGSNHLDPITGENDTRAGMELIVPTINPHLRLSATQCPGNAFREFVETKLQQRVHEYRLAQVAPPESVAVETGLQPTTTEITSDILNISPAGTSYSKPEVTIEKQKTENSSNSWVNPGILSAAATAIAVASYAVYKHETRTQDDYMVEDPQSEEEPVQ